MISVMARRPPRTGRPSKGERQLFVTRLPAPLAEQFRDEADALELTLTDHLANIVAAHYGAPAIVEVVEDAAQERLIA